MSSYGKMTPWLLAKFVGDVSSPAPTFPLCEIPLYWALFTSDPFMAADPLTVEIAPMGYARPESTWSQYGTTGLVNLDDVIFPNIPAGDSIYAVGLFGAAVNGPLAAADVLDAPVPFPLGGTWVLPSGEFFLGFDLVGM